jgi:hypothetical protein
MEMAGATAEFQTLLKKDLPVFNRVLGDNNVALVTAATSEVPSSEPLAE